LPWLRNSSSRAVADHRGKLPPQASDRQYDVFPDGRRFLLNRSLAEARDPVSVVLGWTALPQEGPRP
jgi:hypothetical protein